MAMPMPAHHLLGQKSWNLHFGLKSPRTKVKNHIGHDQKIAGPFSNTCGNWSGVHLVCFKHALLSKSGCFCHVWPWNHFLPVRIVGSNAAAKFSKKEPALGKAATLGVPRNLHLMMENVQKQRSKTHHVPSPQERNTHANANEN